MAAAGTTMATIGEKAATAGINPADDGAGDDDSGKKDGKGDDGDDFRCLLQPADLGKASRLFICRFDNRIGNGCLG